MYLESGTSSSLLCEPTHQTTPMSAPLYPRSRALDQVSDDEDPLYFLHSAHGADFYFDQGGVVAIFGDDGRDYCYLDRHREDKIICGYPSADMPEVFPHLRVLARLLS